MQVMNTMLPRAARKAGAACCAIANGAVRLSASVSSQLPVVDPLERRRARSWPR